MKLLTYEELPYWVDIPEFALRSFLSISRSTKKKER